MLTLNANPTHKFLELGIRVYRVRDPMSTFWGGLSQAYTIVELHSFRFNKQPNFLEAELSVTPSPFMGSSNSALKSNSKIKPRQF